MQRCYGVTRCLTTDCYTLLQHRHPSVEEEEEATEEETEEEEMMAEESGKVGRITRCLTSCYYHKYIDVFLL